MKLLSNFTGLYTDRAIIERVRKMRECEATRAKKVPLSFTKKGGNSSAARKSRGDLGKAIPAMEAFYAPYNSMLQDLVHPAFVWGPQTHKVR